MFPLSAYADGGGPLLLIANAYIFTFGQVWIIGVESFLIYKYFDHLSYKKSLTLTITINFVSTILGAIILPFLFAAVTNILSNSLAEVNRTLSDFIFAFGTWIAGDHSPNIGLAKAMTIVGFFVTYFITVLMEYFVLIKYLKKYKLHIPHDLLKFSFKLNGISYIGLILTMLIWFIK